MSLHVERRKRKSISRKIMGVIGISFVFAEIQIKYFIFSCTILWGKLVVKQF